MEKLNKRYLTEMANRAARRMRVSGKFSEEEIADMQKKAAPLNNVQPSKTSRKVKKQTQKGLISGDAKKTKAFINLQKQQSGDSSGVSNVHTLQGSGNVATHLGKTKDKYVTQTVNTPDGNKVVSAGDHDAYKNTYKRGLSGQNAAINNTKGFRANNRPKKDKNNTENQSLKHPHSPNNIILESFEDFFNKYNKQYQIINKGKTMTDRQKFILERLNLNEVDDKTTAEKRKEMEDDETNREYDKWQKNKKREDLKKDVTNLIKNNKKNVAKVAGVAAAGAGIAYGIKKLRDRQKEKKRLQNELTQKRLQRSKPNPNESYYYSNDDFEWLSERFGNVGKFSSIIGAGVGLYSLYRAFTSGGNVGRELQNVTNYADNLNQHLKKNVGANIENLHRVIPQKIINDVIFNSDGNAVIIINNENEMCRYFASRSHNNKTNEGIILYVLEFLKQRNMSYNIITYDFFTKYYRRSLTRALSDNESNTNCYNCYNSKHCEFCIDCINCANCKYCIDCVNCRNVENENEKRGLNGSNNSGNDNETQQLMSQYGIAPQDIEKQIGIIMRRQNNDRLIIKRTYQNERDQKIALVALPKTAKEFREKAIQELIDMKSKRLR